MPNDPTKRRRSFTESRALKIAVDVLFQSPTHSTGALSWFTQFARLAPWPRSGQQLMSMSRAATMSPITRHKNPALQVVGAGWGNRRRMLRILSEHFLLGPKP